MFCYKCGGQLPDGAKFCKHCGADLSAVKRPQPKTAQNAEPGYEKTEILMEEEQPHIQPVIRNTTQNKTQNKVVQQPVLQVSKPKQKKRWPIVILLLLVIVLSLGVLAALFVFPDEVQELLAGNVGSRDSVSLEEDDDNEEESVEENEDNEETKEAESDVEPSEEGLKWASEFSSTIEALSKNTYPLYSMADIDGDGIPEIIAGRTEGTGGKVVYHYDEEHDISKLSTNGEVLTYCKSGAMICDSYVEGYSAYDVIYELKDGEFKKIFEGNYRADAAMVLDNYYNPNLIFNVDGKEVNSSAYYSNIESMYLNKGVTDLSEIGSVSYDKMLEILKADDPVSEYNNAASKDVTNAKWQYDYLANVQYFLAPYSGKYRFTLYGANGGGDGDAEFGDEAAVLMGTMNLKAGERVVILTGGRGAANKDYWDFARNKGCEVPGGFNGGGECFSSGSGGGCTDIYYRNIRVAAAAGAGGGNYDSGTEGKPGRTSTAKDNLSSCKKGGGSATVDVGGSGAGWYGGGLAKPDQGGYGGINGWDSSVFTLEQEFEGAAFTMSGSRDGSALVEYLGN